MINIFNILNVDKINPDAFVMLGLNPSLITCSFNNKRPIGVRFELFTVERFSPSKTPTEISVLQARLFLHV